MNKLIGYLCLASVIGSAVATDYCSKSLCIDGPHIGCENTGKFGDRCTTDAAMVNLDSLKTSIVEFHNTKRNLMAGGTVADYKPACRMATMQWDDELASIAALNVRQCTVNYDKCHNTDAFKYSGQNIFKITFNYVNFAKNYHNFVQTAIDMWYAERFYGHMNQINSYPNYKTEKVISHFTVMVADRNIRVGCAAATFNTHFLFTCNYATTNVLGYPIYTSCSSAGSKCITGKNPQYPNLCSASEVYDVNNLSRKL